MGIPESFVLEPGLYGKPAGTGLRCPDTTYAPPREDCHIIRTKEEINAMLGAKTIASLKLTGKEDMILAAVFKETAVTDHYHETVSPKKKCCAKRYVEHEYQLKVYFAGVQEGKVELGVPPTTFKGLSDLQLELTKKKGIFIESPSCFFHVWANHPEPRCCGPDPPGDLNCDYVLDVLDIDAFALAISDPDAYAAAYPYCDIMAGDLNNDGYVDALDIDPFVALLVGP
jgi:hypothetical protein